MITMVRTEAEIEEMVGRAADCQGKPSECWSMSYEDGVLATMMWLTEEGQEPPLGDEE